MAKSTDGSITASILHRFHFNSNLKRMSALVRVEEKGKAQRVQAVMKGAPEVVKQFLGKWLGRRGRAWEEQGGRRARSG